jgi:hypothetical protein
MGGGEGEGAGGVGGQDESLGLAGLGAKIDVKVVGVDGLGIGRERSIEGKGITSAFGEGE